MTGQNTVVTPERLPVLPSASVTVTVHGTSPAVSNGPRPARHAPRVNVIAVLPGAPAGSVQLSVAATTPTLSEAFAVTEVVVGRPQSTE